MADGTVDTPEVGRHKVGPVMAEMSGDAIEGQSNWMGAMLMEVGQRSCWSSVIWCSLDATDCFDVLLELEIWTNWLLVMPSAEASGNAINGCCSLIAVMSGILEGLNVGVEFDKAWFGGTCTCD